MFLSGFEPDDISRPDFFDAAAPFLNLADARKLRSASGQADAYATRFVRRVQR
jgi:hypothetical protein